jgi:ATP-dependent RNA helicase DDX55/SPB4
MNQEVERIGKVGMRNCVYVNVNVGGKGAGGDGKKETPTSLSNYYQVCPLPEKLSRFSSFLLQHGRSRKMIAFFLTCAEADFVGMFLKKALGAKFDFLEVIHGKLTQGRRTEIMSRYRSARSGVLLCTDVAARGLDVGDIDEVVQFDPPQDPSTFVHRVGRAARAGRKGRSLVFLTDQEGAYVEFLKRRGVEVEEIGEGEVRKSEQRQQA